MKIFQNLMTSVCVIFVILFAHVHSAHSAHAAHAALAKSSVRRLHARLKTRIEIKIADIESFLRARRSAEGITPDMRITPFQSEVMRLNIAPQALGYLEIYAHTHDPNDLAEAVSRGDYLLEHFHDVLRNKAYDGMIAYTLLRLYAASGDVRFREYGEKIVAAVFALPEKEIFLNTGLMAIMGWAESYRLNPRPELRDKISQSLTNLALKQNPDGSFAHTVEGGTDLHYSSWMVMQLTLIGQSLSGLDPTIESMLESLAAPLLKFVSSRVQVRATSSVAAGEPSYEDTSCEPASPRTCSTKYYYALKTSPIKEYDTRGWSNELGYHVYTHTRLTNGQATRKTTQAHLRKAHAVLDFMESIESKANQNGGAAYPDKWRDPIDPVREPEQAPFGSEDPSVLRTSILFWTLAAARNQMQ